MRNNIDNLKLQLDEWRRKTVSLDAGYNKVRSRSINLLTIQFGFSSFALVYIDDMIRSEAYGVVFLVLGFILLISSIILSATSFISRLWHCPMHDLEIEKMNNSKNIALVYKVLIDDYKECYDNNLKSHESASKNIKPSIYLFALSAIMLLTLMFA